MRKLADHTRVNDEVVDDFPLFRQVIGQEMLAGLIDEDNQQLLTGTGDVADYVAARIRPRTFAEVRWGSDMRERASANAHESAA